MAERRDPTVGRRPRTGDWDDFPAGASKPSGERTAGGGGPGSGPAFDWDDEDSDIDEKQEKPARSGKLLAIVLLLLAALAAGDAFLFDWRYADKARDAVGPTVAPLVDAVRATFFSPDENRTASIRDCSPGDPEIPAPYAAAFASGRCVDILEAGRVAMKGIPLEAWVWLGRPLHPSEDPEELAEAVRTVGELLGKR